tara:strand:- start:1658 stop:3466 length:1809 start_codon:yes stop_codon:yes gene_type:complete
MAVATYTTDLTDIDLAEVVTNYSALGGGGAGLAADIDFAIQGTYSINKQVSGALKGIVYDSASVTIIADTHFYVWLYCTTPGMLDTEANGGMRVTIGTSTANYTEWYVKGATEYAEGGWICFPVRYQTTAPSPGSITGTPGASPTHVGGQVFTTASVKAVNFGLDAQRYGSTVTFTGGTVADPEATFTGAADKNDLVANRWGQLSNKPGGFALQGKLKIGDSGNACELLESGKLMTITDTPFTLTDFSEILVENASTILTLDGFTFLGLGTNNLGRFEVITTTATVALTSTVFKDFGVCIFGSGSTLTGCSFLTSAAITQNGATITGSTVENNTAAIAITADDAASISDSSFTSDGTGHAVEIAPVGAGPFTINYSGNTDSGYAATDGSTGNETILINPATASADITLNIIGGGTTPTIMEDAGYTGTFTLVVSPVTLDVKVTTTTGTDIENARVIVLVGDGANFPFDVTVTATSSGTTATITHTAHGLDSNNYIQVTGANEENYNGAFQITVTGVNTYTYVMTASDATPATGTLKATTVLLTGLTDVNGEISDTRSYGVDQAITGRVRKSSGSPFYKTSGIVGTVTAAAGLTVNTQLIGDE